MFSGHEDTTQNAIPSLEGHMLANLKTTGTESHIKRGISEIFIWLKPLKHSPNEQFTHSWPDLIGPPNFDPYQLKKCLNFCFCSFIFRISWVPEKGSWWKKYPWKEHQHERDVNSTLEVQEGWLLPWSLQRRETQWRGAKNNSHHAMAW